MRKRGAKRNPVARFVRRIPQKRVESKKKAVKQGYRKHRGLEDGKIPY